MRTLLVILLLAACCVPGTTIAQTQIHTCKDADGGIVYSQLPCKEEKPDDIQEPADAEPAEPIEPETARELPVPANLEDEPVPTADQAACKKRYRDAIDAIDAEIRSEYSPEKDGEYKQRLLVLTRKLRECGGG